MSEADFYRLADRLVPRVTRMIDKAWMDHGLTNDQVMAIWERIQVITKRCINAGRQVVSGCVCYCDDRGGIHTVMPLPEKKGR